LTRFVAWLYQEIPQPAVFDADALAALAAEPPTATDQSLPRILTPHPGEFARLAGERTYSTSEERAEIGAGFATQWGVVLVLKGHRTLVTDGNRCYVNTTGNPGMATGGTGDVLTGIITGLLCQGLDPFEAAQLGVYLHGAAGDLAAAEVGQVSLVAGDLLEFLPAAIRQYIGE
jgi:NAD(P)H-hydrate epimerase